MFRRVDLPTRVPGKLMLHSMSGRFEAIGSGDWGQKQGEFGGATKVFSGCLNESVEWSVISLIVCEPVGTRFSNPLF